MCLQNYHICLNKTQCMCAFDLCTGTVIKTTESRAILLIIRHGQSTILESIDGFKKISDGSQIPY